MPQSGSEPEGGGAAPGVHSFVGKSVGHGLLVKGSAGVLTGGRWLRKVFVFLLYFGTHESPDACPQPGNKREL